MSERLPAERSILLPPEEGDDQVTPEAKDRYLLGDELGRGGQAVILRATDRHIGREVALKMMRSRFGESGSSGPSSTPYTLAQARFLREARVTAQLEHPGIVPVYEVGRRADGTRYCTQRLIRGQTLREALAGCPDLAARLALLPRFVDACQAVAYAHARGVIHRDLKPANLMVGSLGETQVIDWGLARVRGGPEGRTGSLNQQAERLRDDQPARLDETQDGSVLGTPAYMSPEQARGDLAHVDERSDVWSLGAVLFEILAGEPAFRGKSSAQILFQVCQGLGRPVLELCPRAPPELAAVVERALQVDRSLRYPSAAELAAEVAAYERGERVQAFEYSTLALLRRFVTRNPAVTALSLLALLLIGFTTVALYGARLRTKATLSSGLVWQATQASVARNCAAAAALFAAARVQDDSAVARAGLLACKDRAPVQMLRERGLGPVFSLAFSPDGRTLAAVTGSRVLLWSPAAGQALTSAARASFELGQPGKSVAWLPDGSALAVALADAVALIDARSGQVVRRLTSSTTLQAVAVAADGSELAAVGRGHEVLVWRLPSGQSLKLPPLRDRALFSVSFSPDGQEVFAGGAQGVLHRLRLPDGAAGPELTTGGLVAGVTMSPEGRQGAALDFDGSVRLFDRATSRELRRFPARALRFDHRGVSFSPDGRLLGVPGDDDSAWIYDLSRGELLARLEAHQGPVVAVQFGATGLLATGSLDGEVVVWDVRPALSRAPGEPSPEPLREPKAELAAVLARERLVLHRVSVTQAP